MYLLQKATSVPKFCPQNTLLPIDFIVGDIRSQIVAERLKIAQRSQWRAYRKRPSLFRKIPSLTRYDFPIHPKWGLNCTLMTCRISNLCKRLSDSFHVYFYGFRGRRVKRRYLWFHEIRHGGSRAISPLPFCQITLVLVKTQLRDTICKFVLQIDDNMHCRNF